MTETTTTSRRIPITRRSDRRVLGGLSSGIADAIAVDTAYVRAAFIVLSLAGGIGVVLYGLGWLLTIDSTADEPTPPLVIGSPSEVRRSIGFQLVIVGFLVFASTIGLTLSASVVWPATLVVLGTANVWAHGDSQSRALLQGILPGSDTGSPTTRSETLIRLAAGGALVAGGIALTIASTDALRQAGGVVLAAAITLLGLAVVLGPWVYRLWRQLADERRERIRSEEKTEIAAHLHDSVLQTLALIQSSSDPEQQAVLARIQERELRQWLFGDDDDADATLKAMMDAVAAEIERSHKIVVESVTVGDTEVTTDVAALVAATREALINAAKHSGERAVSLYTEVSEDDVEVFITDQGHGFDPNSVDEDRLGIAESIRGRMQRHGGGANITSTPGDGTEVHLTLPIRSNP